MEIAPEGKIWTVVEAIADGYEIAPSGGDLLLDPKQVVKVVSDIELTQILAKLERDHKIIKIKSRPNDLTLGEGQGCYAIVIPDQETFRTFLNRAHSQHYGDVNYLASDNFLAVCDVVMDIDAELQLTSDNQIRIIVMRDVIRFPNLFPGDGINMRDRYSELRLKALGYLKERGHIKHYEIDDDPYANRWSRKIEVLVDRYDFDKFYKRLMETYERRVSNPAKEKEAKSKKETASPSSSKQEELPKTLSVHIRDRQIWVNDFMLSKPHAVGGNKGFFDYVFENAGQPLDRDQMPDYVKEDVKGKSFSKVLNELGFKGEILKAFCPERGKSQLLFRKEVAAKQLESEGINLELFLQELRTAHTRNSPK